MLDNIKKYWDKFQSLETIRYLIAGGLTTLVNLIVFAIVRYGMHLGLSLSNFIAIVAAIIFAYFINKYYAFRSNTKGVARAITEFLKFVGGRLFSMVIEIAGVYILAVWNDTPEMLAKILTQVIVVIVNYFISKIFVFNNKKESRSFVEWLKDNYVYIIAFILPAALFIAVCVKYKITPFGENTMMIIDSLHQYIPFFSEYYDKLTKTGEFLYSWNGAGGYNFLTLWAYYLSSPFNLLILFFSKENINMALTLIIGLKICLSSVTMTYMLTKKFNNKGDMRAVLFGLCYAFSNYVIGYYWNVMWLDVLMLTPLVILGLEYLIERKDCRLYVLTLFGSLFCNFYISFMLCIFLVMWFIAYPHKSVKEFFANGVRFAISSIVAAGMAAFVLIPTYTGIMLTGPASSEVPESSWYGKVIDLLKKFCIYSGSITNQSEDGGVNLYCGMIAIFLLILYFCVKKISLWEKVKKLVMIAFFIASFNNTVLNYIWHGFHDQFGIPNRFSFLLIFLVLVMGYEVLCHAKDISFWLYFVPLAVLGVVVLYNNEGTALFTDEKVMRYTMIAIIGYFIVFMLYVILEWKERTLGIILTIAVAAEISFNAIYSFQGNGQIGMEYYFGDSPSMRVAAESVDDGTFYREELSKNKLVDENFWLNLKSLGIFGSTANGDAVDFYNHIGFYTAANEHLYNGSTPFSNSLLGVKYLYKRQNDYFDHGFNYLNTVEGVDIYENPYALSLGYMVDEGVLGWNDEQYQPTDNINDFIHTALNLDGDMFTALPDDFVGTGENCDVTWNGTGDGTYAYSRTTDGALTVSLNITAKDNKPIYVRATGTDLSAIDVYINGEMQCTGRYFFQLLPVGDTVAGDQITVKFSFTGSEADNQTVNLKAYSFEEDVFQQMYSQLSQNQLAVTEYTSDEIKGQITAAEDGIMMTSIINEPGWKVYVDGEEQKVLEIGDSMIGVKLSAGTHDIRIRFVPKSLPIAAAISLLSIAAFVVYIRRYNNREEQEYKVMEE